MDLYAAVAAKISTRRAVVTKARLSENNAVELHTIPSLEFVLSTLTNTMIEMSGNRDESTVERMDE